MRLLPALFLCVPPLLAQGPIQLPRTTLRVTVDGKLDDAAWREARQLPLVMHQPTAGSRPIDSSDVRVIHDQEALYIGARLVVSSAEMISDASLVRDVEGPSDLLRVLIDAANDNENGVVFETTPSGVLVDYSVSADGRIDDRGWNAFWDVVTTKDAGGWTAEMRIPWSSLRFEASGDSVAMGVTVARFNARRNTWDSWPRLGNEFANALNRPSIAQQVVVRGVASRRAHYLTPFAVMVHDHSARSRGAGRFAYNDSAAAQFGVDYRTNVTDNLSLDLTYNTDFAQVEADDQQVNLTRFSLFFPEKRQFFLERAGLLQLRTGGQDDPSQFFFSRRIGLSDDGLPLRIQGGGRLVGRVGSWDVGAVNMQVSDAANRGSENLSTLRLRRRVLNPQSTVGLFATSRYGDADRDNVAVAMDARLRVFRQDFITLQAAHAEDFGGTSGRGDTFQDGLMWRAEWARPSDQTTAGPGYIAGLTRTGSSYNPGLGFTPRRDYTHLFTNVRYGFQRGGNAWLRLVQPSLVATRFTDNADGAVESAFQAAFLNWDARSGWNGFVGFNWREELLRGPLPLSATTRVPAGRYRYQNANASVSTPRGRALRLTVFAGAGELYDGRQISAGLFPFWTPSPHLTLGVEYNVTRLEFASRGQRLNGDVIRLRINAAADSRLSMNAFLQANVAADLLVPNVRLRYRFREGRDLYLVYNERLNTDLDRLGPDQPLLPRSASRAFVLKYTHVFAR